MTKGAQDWIARTDLLLQTLSELITRNKYGAFQSYYSLQISPPHSTALALEVSGKGIIFGGQFIAYAVPAARHAFVTFYLDNSPISQVEWNFEDLLYDNVVTPGIAAFYVTQYNLVNNVFAGGITLNLTFESNLRVYINPGDYGVSYLANIWYATV